jgi:hypothetical protein
MAHFYKSTACFVVLMTTLACGTTALAELQPYKARYAVYRNGSLLGKVEVLLEQQGETWIVKSEGNGTHGLARILGARDNEQAYRGN